MWRIALIAALVGTCAPFTRHGEWRRVIGNVNPSLSSIQMVQLPQEARVDVPITVTVMTLGSSSCTRVDDTVVEANGLSVTITPYDRVAPPGTPCTRDLRAFPHPVQLRFAAAGDARITVVGRDEHSRAVSYELVIPVR